MKFVIIEDLPHYNREINYYKEWSDYMFSEEGYYDWKNDEDLRSSFLNYEFNHIHPDKNKDYKDYLDTDHFDYRDYL